MLIYVNKVMSGKPVGISRANRLMYSHTKKGSLLSIQSLK